MSKHIINAFPPFFRLSSVDDSGRDDHNGTGANAAILEKLDHIWQEYMQSKREEEEQCKVEQQWRDAALVLNRLFLFIYLLSVLVMFVYIFIHGLFFPTT